MNVIANEKKNLGFGFSVAASTALRTVMFSVTALSALLLTTSGCTGGAVSQNKISGAAGLRPITKAEAKTDLNDLAEAIRNYYGPLQYKEKRFGFKIDDLISKADKEIDESKSDADIFGSYQRLLTSLHDAHVSVSFPSSSIPVSKYTIPIFITPVEGHALVDAVDVGMKDLGINRGDEVISVDGKAVADYLPIINKYKTYSNEVSDAHLIYMVFSRPFYITELIPKQSTAHVVFAHPDESTYALDLVWRSNPSATSSPSIVPSNIPSRNNFTVAGLSDFNDAAQGSLLSMGNPTPYFANARTAQVFNWVRVEPNAEAKAKVGLTDKTTPSIFSVLYRYKGKTILLVRQPSYAPTDFPLSSYMRAYVALLSQYESLVDVLVIDQTHNPGGSGAYCSAFFSLFGATESNAAVEFVRADRKWIFDLKIDALQGLKPGSEEAMQVLAMGTQVEEAYDHGQFLTPSPIPIFSGGNTISPTVYSWGKPMLVLQDELAGSCGDAFPMLVKANKTAKIFGNRTIGAGGNVEEIITLSNSRASVHLTRGLFTAYSPTSKYPDENFVENNGVTPDYQYTVSVMDYRMGFMSYVKAFSEKAVAQVAPEPTEPGLIPSLPQ
jgi:hypothetical protein